ncbi:MAG: hypothetical protein WC881_09875 [Elusimicrobiota bacterium]|jgi:hypothetical protein
MKHNIAGIAALMFGLFLASTASAATKTLYTVPNDKDVLDFAIPQTLPVKKIVAQKSSAPKDMSTNSRDGAFELKLMDTMRSETKTISVNGAQPAKSAPKTLITKA